MPVCAMCNMHLAMNCMYSAVAVKRPRKRSGFQLFCSHEANKISGGMLRVDPDRCITCHMVMVHVPMYLVLYESVHDIIHPPIPVAPLHLCIVTQFIQFLYAFHRL